MSLRFLAGFRCGFLTFFSRGFLAGVRRGNSLSLKLLNLCLGRPIAQPVAAPKDRITGGMKQSRNLARRKAGGLMAIQFFITFGRPIVSSHCPRKADSRSIGNRHARVRVGYARTDAGGAIGREAPRCRRGGERPAPGSSPRGCAAAPGPLPVARFVNSGTVAIALPDNWFIEPLDL